MPQHTRMRRGIKNILDTSGILFGIGIILIGDFLLDPIAYEFSNKAQCLYDSYDDDHHHGGNNTNSSGGGGSRDADDPLLSSMDYDFIDHEKSYNRNSTITMTSTSSRQRRRFSTMLLVKSTTVPASRRRKLFSSAAYKGRRNNERRRNKEAYDSVRTYCAFIITLLLTSTALLIQRGDSSQAAVVQLHVNSKSGNFIIGTLIILLFLFALSNTSALTVIRISIVTAQDLVTTTIPRHVCSSVVFTWYMTALSASPLLIKTITSSFIALLGDAFAQHFEFTTTLTIGATTIRHNVNSNLKNTQQHQRQQCKDNEKTTSRKKNFYSYYDKQRGLSVFCESLFISGPLMHFAYEYMEELIPIENDTIIVVESFATSLRPPHFAAMAQVLIDNFVLDTFFLFIMYVTTGIGEGYTLEEIWNHQLRTNFIPTATDGMMTGIILIPIQFVLFRFVPKSLRVLGVNIIDVFWDAYVSYVVHRQRKRRTTMQ